MEDIFLIATSFMCATSGFSQKRLKSNNMQNAVLNMQGELLIQASGQSSSGDFNFLVGSHQVQHKKLKSRLTHSTEWLEFEGTHVQEQILNGIGNIEHHRMVDGVQTEGMALRLFNPKTKLWSIYWADSRTGALSTPVIGSFENRIGHFYAKDNHNGRGIIIQFKWDITNVNKPVWSQAFSVDNGSTWEWNWHMYFTRTGSGKSTLDRRFGETESSDSIGIVEVRNYLLKRGKRDEFINFFENNLIGPQEHHAGRVIGQYRVKGNDDNFFWIRGFNDMKRRSAFLPAFYYSESWKQHRNAANDMIANNDNVYLLRPLDLQAGTLIAVSGIKKERLNQHLGVAVIDFYTANSKLNQLKQFFAKTYLPLLRSAGVQDPTIWESELTENDFPRLPVFQDKNLLVTITFYEDEDDYNSKLNFVKSKMNANVEAEYLDAVTTKNILILYPTEFSKKNVISGNIRESEGFTPPLLAKPVKVLTSGVPDIKASSTSNLNDFDFIIGPHNVLHNKLAERLKNSTSWVESGGSKTTEKILGGFGNLERHFLNDNAGNPIEAIALRLFDPATKLWSLYWADSKNGVLDPPLVGSFEDQLGAFFGQDSVDGKNVLVQFQYDRSDPQKPIWGQSFSEDNGKTWEWNWFMFFERKK